MPNLTEHTKPHGKTHANLALTLGSWGIKWSLYQSFALYHQALNLWMVNHSLEIETIDQDNHMQIVHNSNISHQNQKLLHYNMMACKSMVKRWTCQELVFNLESEWLRSSKGEIFQMSIQFKGHWINDMDHRNLCLIMLKLSLKFIVQNLALSLEDHIIPFANLTNKQKDPFFSFSFFGVENKQKDIINYKRIHRMSTDSGSLFI